MDGSFYQAYPDILGLPENHDFIFLFYCTTLILDTVFKY